MTDFTLIVKTIVEHQRVIIGPLAVEQANKVSGLSVIDEGGINVKVTGNNVEVLLTDLVHRYEELFGRASIEVCKDAIREIKPQVSSDELPQILR